MRAGSGSALLLAVALSAAAPAPRLVLTGTGVSVAGRTLPFGSTPRAAAIAAVSGVLGGPVRTGSHGDCGQGDVITYAKFRGDFELLFVGGKLMGWTEDGAALATDRGLRNGMTVAALRRLYRDVDLTPSMESEGGPSASFQLEGGPTGWIENLRPTGHVVGLFAGTTCLPGV